MHQFGALGEVVARIYADLHGMYYLLLPVAMSIAIAMTWLRGPGGGAEFLPTLQRAFVGTLLLVGFQEITDAILMVTSGLANRIDDLSGLDALIEMASAKAESYTLSPTSLLEGFNDLLIATLSFVSYVLLYLARYVTLALYHFSWAFLSLLAPLILVFHVYSSKLTVSLFRSLFEIAAWRIVWAVLSAMLASLPFGDAYAAEGTYLTVIVMNFVISICMLGTPFVVHGLVGSGFASVAASLSPVVSSAITSVPGKAMNVLQVPRSMASGSMVRSNPSN